MLYAFGMLYDNRSVFSMVIGMLNNVCLYKLAESFSIEIIQNKSNRLGFAIYLNPFAIFTRK